MYFEIWFTGQNSGQNITLVINQRVIHTKQLVIQLKWEILSKTC